MLDVRVEELRFQDVGEFEVCAGVLCGCEFVGDEEVEFGREDEVEGVAEGLRVECYEGMFFCRDVVGVDVGGEDAVREVDFCVGYVVGAVDVEHRFRGVLGSVERDV